MKLTGKQTAKLADAIADARDYVLDHTSTEDEAPEEATAIWAVETMTHLEEMFTPPASASYAQVEAYEIGRIMGRTDRQLSLKHVQRGPWGDYMTSEAAWQGYEAGWAETVPDDR